MRIDAAYVALVTDEKRAGTVVQYLREDGLSEGLMERKRSSEKEPEKHLAASEV